MGAALATIAFFFYVPPGDQDDVNLVRGALIKALDEGKVAVRRARARIFRVLHQQHGNGHDVGPVVRDSPVPAPRAW